MVRNPRLQVSLDFLSSYGIAMAVMFVILVALYVFVLSPNNPSVFCTSVPGFSCSFISLSSSGVLTLRLAQATGTQITINGVGCASQQSPIADAPAYGNVGVNSLVQYYPMPTYPPGNTFYSGSAYTMKLYCYNSGGIAKGSIGSTFQGIVWLNYTILNYGVQTQKVITFSAVYS